MLKKVGAKVKKKAKKSVVGGIMHVSASFNNTIVTITDMAGNKLTSSSAGSNGFKGARKSTPHAAQRAAEAALAKAKELGIKTLSVILKGISPVRDSAIRPAPNFGITVLSIIDNTPIAHNGVRPPKRRRV